MAEERFWVWQTQPVADMWQRFLYADHALDRAIVSVYRVLWIK